MKEISVQELKEKKDSGEDFQLIDVREDFEYEMSNLDGLLIPLGGILIEAGKIEKNKPVVIMCRSGKRSAAAIMQLEQQGFTNLYNLHGGILAWADEIDPNISVYQAMAKKMFLNVLYTIIIFIGAITAYEYGVMQKQYWYIAVAAAIIAIFITLKIRLVKEVRNGQKNP